MSIVSLVIAPTLATFFATEAGGEKSASANHELTITLNNKGADINPDNIKVKLENAGFLKAGENAKVEMKDGKLFINGKKVDKNIQLRLNIDEGLNFSLNLQND